MVSLLPPPPTSRFNRMQPGVRWLMVTRIGSALVSGVRSFSPCDGVNMWETRIK
jgi:hypothetical protein